MVAVKTGLILSRICHDSLFLECREVSLVKPQLSPALVARLDESVGNPWIDLIFSNIYLKRLICSSVLMFIGPCRYFKVKGFTGCLSHQRIPFLERNLYDSFFSQHLEHIFSSNGNHCLHPVSTLNHEVHRGNVGRHSHPYVIRKNGRLLTRLRGRGIP